MTADAHYNAGREMMADARYNAGREMTADAHHYAGMMKGLHYNVQDMGQYNVLGLEFPWKYSGTL